MCRSRQTGTGTPAAANNAGGTCHENPAAGFEDMTKLIISRIEKNQRHVCDAELRILAKALNVSMEWLVGDVNIFE